MEFPQLSETWAGAYIQILVAVLIFFVGLPLLITQLSMPEDIRRIYFRYQKKWIILIIIITIISAILLIWYVHPCPGIISSFEKSIIISVLVTIILSSFLYIYWKLYNQNRLTLINNIFINCLVNGGLNQAFKDLAYLGECGKQGDEKYLVVKKISDITKIIIKKQIYHYHMFDHIIDAVRKTVINRFQSGNEDNFRSVLYLLNEIHEYYILNLPESQYDKRSVDKVIGELCIKCLNLGFIETAILYQQVMKEDTNELLKIGITAIQLKKYNLAVACLNDIESNVVNILEDNNILREKDLFQLIGLAAHIWAINAVSHDRVLKAFNLFNNINISISNCLESAKKEYSSIQDYSTAQQINNLLHSEVFRENLQL
ncbi:MAG: hypothetical protein NTW49_11845 [Bacteroidia bacterium]|nr:hypothetical protein [Bacteroidia bacterium]